MTASLYEAFGDNYETYPPNDNNQMKKRKKAGKKVSSYGHEIPQRKYLSSEPKQNINLEIGTADDYMNDQYLQIGNGSEFGPTDYNIKPKDVQEYVSQLSNVPQNFHPNNINDSTNYIVDQNSMNSVFKGQQQQIQRATSFNNDNDSDGDSDNEYKQTQTQTPTQTQTQNGKKMSSDDPRMVEFNNKLDLILQKLGHFDEPAQENIHDIILFVIFGVFVIFILDSVYRVGKMTL